MATRLMLVSGRWPFGLTMPTGSDRVQINSGITVVLPNTTSALFATLSCLGTGSAQGQIGLVAGQSFGTPVAGNVIAGKFVSVTGMERTTGTTEVPKGGGTAY